jgi:hypothetical protein
MDDAPLVAVHLRLARDAVRKRQAYESSLPVDVKIGDRVELGAKEIAGHVSAGLTLIASGHEERGTEDLCGSRYTPTIRIIWRETGLRERRRERRSDQREENVATQSHGDLESDEAMVDPMPGPGESATEV